MLKKIFLKNVFIIFLLTLCAIQASAQVQELAEIKDVNLTFELKYEDFLLEKGKYDLIFIRNLPSSFLLKIKRQGKTIGLISGGEKVNYPDQGNLEALLSNPDIPKVAKLTIKRPPGLKIAYVILETGKHTKICPFYKIRFKFDCLE